MKILYQFCWEGWEFNRVRYLSCRCKPLNRIQRNLTGSKISTSSTKFVFFGLICKQKWLPWPILQKGGTLNSDARYVALLASCSIFLFLLTKLFTHIKQGLQKYCKTAYSRSGINQMWILTRRGSRNFRQGGPTFKKYWQAKKREGEGGTEGCGSFPSCRRMV